MTVLTESSVVLRDGRVLEYDTIGNTSDPAVLWLHGAGDSRHGRPPQAEIDGVFIVLPNRPGYGKSTRHAGRTLLDFADDAIELMDHLGIDRFSPIGWSAGCSHALAIAAKHGNRVDSVGAYGGAISLETEGWKNDVAPGMVMLYEAGRENPAVITAAFANMPTLMNTDPDAAVDLYCATEPTLRTLVDADPGVRAQVIQDIREGNAQGTEVFAEDIRVIQGAWPFSLADITMKVQLWHGSEDLFTPPAWGDLLARALPDAEVHVIEGAGHSQVYERAVWETVILGVVSP